MSNVLLEARQIQKSFKKGKLHIPVLKAVDFTVTKGETVAIVGASGAGKSTLLHILGTLEKPSSGRLFYEGQDVLSLSDKNQCEFRNRNLGFIFQFHYLLPEFTALENVMMPGLIAGRTEHSLKKEAEDLLRLVGLSHRLTHRPSELSGGESQRVAVARALIMKPKVILGDELTGNLDSENSIALFSMLLGLNKTLGVSIVVVTHDRSLASKMSRIVEMKDGVLLQDLRTSVD